MTRTKNFLSWALLLISATAGANGDAPQTPDTTAEATAIAGAQAASGAISGAQATGGAADGGNAVSGDSSAVSGPATATTGPTSASNEGLSAEYRNEQRSLALGLAAVPGATYASQCHESHGGKGNAAILQFGGRSEINEACLCNDTALRLLSAGLVEIGLTALKACGVVSIPQALIDSAVTEIRAADDAREAVRRIEAIEAFESEQQK